MIDIADIRLVDTHAESDGGDYNGPVRDHEPVLNLGPQRVPHSRVVGAGFEACLDEAFRHQQGGVLQGDIDVGPGELACRAARKLSPRSAAYTWKS